jgi:putative PIN family toxin of toxin-antitoxin system
MKRVVLDTNVLVSSLLLRGQLSKFVDLWKNREVSPVLSKETFEEFNKVLHYPKFSLSEDEIKTIIEDEVLPFFDITEIKEKITGVCRDHEDDMFLSAAVNARAAVIVTGDKDLLDLKKYRSIKILSPQDFLALLKR